MCVCVLIFTASPVFVERHPDDELPPIKEDHETSQEQNSPECDQLSAEVREDPAN